MNHTSLEPVDAAITMLVSPPVQVAGLVVPRSMLWTSAGAPATPLPTTPTSTAATVALPASLEALDGM